jgi:hypothetical protein
VQWVLDHDEEARRIAVATKDGLHPDANSDTVDEIYRDILKVQEPISSSRMI